MSHSEVDNGLPISTLVRDVVTIDGRHPDPVGNNYFLKRRVSRTHDGLSKVAPTVPGMTPRSSLLVRDVGRHSFQHFLRQRGKPVDAGPETKWHLKTH